ncbi:MAG: replicative DNA helicase [Clostridia bacterium]|nr:replicative DNA helicase [Clostridia bacterium]
MNQEPINPVIQEPDSPAELSMPFSNEAEQSVLGAIYLDRNCIPDVVGTVRGEDFYISRHRELFEAIVELYNTGKPIDLVTLKEHLTLRGTLEKIGGISFVVEVANLVPSTDSVRFYAEIVRDKAVQRRMIRMAEDIRGKCYRGDEETDDILAAAQQSMIEISQDRSTRGLVHIGRYLDEGLEKLEKLSQKSEGITGIPTGFIDLDRRTSGLHAAELIILAARPAMGKSSFALNIAQNVAVKSKKNVAIFSLEMPGIQVANRLLSAEAKLSSEKIKKGDIKDDEWGKIGNAISVLAQAGIYVDDTSSITVSEIGARCRKMMLERGLDLVVIDYLQLISGSGKGASRQQEITEISRSLKILANDLNIPIIALSQLSRAADKEKREPVLSDLRDSGAIEQDADMVMFLHREGYYHEDAEEPNKAKCNFAKHRNGEVGYDFLTWIGEYTMFADWSGDHAK